MRCLHLIAFDIPYPPDYGGIVAVFDMLQVLHQNGIGVKLHVFQYNSKELSPELYKYCQEIFVYKRNTSWTANLSLKPYIVNSRNHKDLYINLQKDNFPILIEGIHCSYFLPQLCLENRKILVRAHNIEWKYYHQLYLQEHSLLKKIYFKIESLKLRWYEPYIFKKASAVTCFNENEENIIKQYNKKTLSLNLALANLEVKVETGKGSGILIHGNLSINDMAQAVTKILTVLKNKYEGKIVIAGKNPSISLKNTIKQYGNAILIENPHDSELINIIKSAHVNLCYTNIAEGFKMRLLPLLKYGKFILCNEAFCSETELKPLLIIENDLKNWPKIVDTYMQTEFANDDLETRIRAIEKIKGLNDINRMISIIFENSEPKLKTNVEI